MLDDIARLLIQRCSRHLEPPPFGLSCYEFWVASEEEVSPGVSNAVRQEALTLLSSEERLLSRSAIQALACVGKKEDVQVLADLRNRVDAMLLPELDEAIAHLGQRLKSLEELLQEVNSEKSFVLFAHALAKERDAASKLESAEPERYRLNGALGWQNADISSFIFSGLTVFNGASHSGPPSWKDFADFLYQGKIYE